MNPTLQIIAICAPILVALLTASWKLAWLIKDMEEKLIEKIGSVKTEISAVETRVTVLEFAHKRGRKGASVRPSYSQD